MQGSFVMKIVAAEEIYPLRKCLLRQGMPQSSVVFEGDGEPYSLHAAFYLEDELIGIASLIRRKSSHFEVERQYQLRGMAVKEEYRGQGVGKALLQYCEFLCLNRGVNFLWCNARISAKDFYAKNGFETIGEVFYIAPICDHIVMYKEVKEHKCEGCKNA